MVSFQQGVPSIARFFVGVAGTVTLLVLIPIAYVVMTAPPEPTWQTFAAQILGISRLPASASKGECKHEGLIDVSVTCSFELEPRDFTMLLDGHKFKTVQLCSTTPGTPICVPERPSRESDDFGEGPRSDADLRINTVDPICECVPAGPSGTSHDFGGSLRSGVNFRIDIVYSTELSEEDGALRIATDRFRHYVLVNYYTR